MLGFWCGAEVALERRGLTEMVRWPVLRERASHLNCWDLTRDAPCQNTSSDGTDTPDFK